jgi:mRNA interferase MazF
MAIHRGDIYWLADDPRSAVAHPYVVVQDDVFNHSRIAHVVVCARLGEKIGQLSQARVEQILAGLRFQQTSFFAR